MTESVIPASAVNALLRPRSIAIIGISERKDAIGNRAADTLKAAAFDNVFYVSRSLDMLHGKACYKDISELPEGIDAAILAVPAAHALRAVEACAARGIRAAALFSAGFAETGPEGVALQERLAAFARASGMAILGPNTVGLTNNIDKVTLTFGGHPPHAVAGRPYCAVIAQSGAMAGAMKLTLQQRGINQSFMIATGNEAVIGVEDLLPFVIADEVTRCVAIFAEQIRDPARFIAAAQEAARLQKPIILLHPGKSAGAQESAASHTGALSGDYAVMQAVLRAVGVLLVDTFEDFLDMAEMLTLFPHPLAAGPAVMSDSGAVRGLSLDGAEALHLELPALGPKAQAALEARLPSFAQAMNPLDMTAQGLADIGLYEDCAAVMIGDDAIGGLIAAIMPGSPKVGLAKAQATLAGMAHSAKPKAFAILGEAPVDPELPALVAAAGMPLYRSHDRALRVFKHLARAAIATAQANIPADILARAGKPSLAEGAMSETQSKRLLAAYGIPVPDHAVVEDADAAVDAAARLSYPVVLKVVSRDIQHKTEVGGVAVGIADAEALRARFAAMQTDLATKAPGAVIDGFMVEKMAGRGVELVIGARRDPQWGAVVLFGLGGIWIEALEDVRLLPAATTRRAILEELQQLRGRALLDGARGAAPVDKGAVADLVLKVAQMVTDYPDIVEVDVNPVVVSAADGQLQALDGLIVWHVAP